MTGAENMPIAGKSNGFFSLSTTAAPGYEERTRKHGQPGVEAPFRRKELERSPSPS
jgi:hypothetical protein